MLIPLALQRVQPGDGAKAAPDGAPGYRLWAGGLPRRASLWQDKARRQPRSLLRGLPKQPREWFRVRADECVVVLLRLKGSLAE